MSENGSHVSGETGPCYFCGQKVDVDEYLCHGCGVLVCADCTDEENDPWGEHEPEEHIAGFPT